MMLFLMTEVILANRNCNELNVSYVFQIYKCFAEQY